jgi:N4-gp56 family major capsid protein
MATTQVFGPGTTPQAGGSIPAEVRQYYANKQLAAALPDLKHAQFCDPIPIPRNTGTTMIMRRWERLSTATTALTEGVTPAGNALTVTPVTVSVAQYGDFVQLSDVISFASIDPVVTDTVERLGFQAAETTDVLSRNFMNIGSNVQYANGRVSRATIQSGDNMTGVEIKKAKRNLARNFAKEVNGSFIGLIHPDTTFDIMSINEWLAVKEYSDKMDLYNGEVGTLYGVRFIETPLGTKYTAAGAGGIDVYGTLIFGRDAFVKTMVDGENLKNIIKPLGSAGAADPLDQRQSAGWKMTYGGVIANQNFVVRVEHATTG